MLEGLDRTDIGLRCPGAHRHAKRRPREIHIRPRHDALRGDEFSEAFPRHDHHVGRHAARELRGDGLWPAALRRTGARFDLDAGSALELRDEIGDDFAFTAEAPELEGFAAVAGAFCTRGQSAESREQKEQRHTCALRSAHCAHGSHPPVNPARFSPVTTCAFFRIVFQTNPLR